jgi:Tol biopolymer transport system component
MAIGLGVGAVATRSLTDVPEPAHPTRFVMTTPSGSEIAQGDLRPEIAISPDGTRIVYATSEGLYVREIDELEPVPLRGGEGGRSPFFSPDGTQVGFFDAVDAALKKVPIEGGLPATLCRVGDFRGASWGPEDTIVFSDGSLKQVPAAGGEPMALSAAGLGQLDVWPHFLPSGEAIVFSMGATVEKRLASLRLTTGKVKELGLAGTGPHYLPSGHLVFTNRGTVHAVAFDAEHLRVLGGPSPVIENVAVNSATGVANLAVSRSGALVYVLGASVDRQLLWVDRSGREVPLPFPADAYYWARVSPDGERIAVQIDDAGSADIWIGDVARGALTRLTTDDAPDRFPIWTPDADRVVFASLRDGERGLYSATVAARGVEERLAAHPEWQGLDPYGWSPGGETLIFSYLVHSTGWDLGKLDADGNWSPVLEASGAQGQPALSPDGEWIAYLSFLSGHSEIYLQRFPELDNRLQISIDGGESPVWSPDGREIIYRDPTHIVAVEIQTTPSLQAGTPVALFPDDYFRGADRTYDISPDGQRFLMVKDATSDANDIIVVLNWLDELERLVPSQPAE